MFHPVEQAHLAVAETIGCSVQPLTDGVALIHPLLTLRSFNCVSCGSAATLPQLVDQARSLYAAHGRPLMLALAEHVAAAGQNWLHAHGWQPQTPIQLFMVHEAAPPLLPAAEITELTAALIPTFVAILHESFGWSVAVRDQQLAHYRDLVAQTIGRHYLALADGVPVAATSLFAAGDAMRRWGVYKVATLPPYRGRGLASALVARALHAAYAGGAESVFLYTQADSPAVAMYARLGFVPAFQRTIYVAAASH